jgi:hypothetical protein
MIELTANKIATATNKARIVKPLVKVLEFGSYRVTNKATGASYTVTCKRAGNLKLASCTCRAGLKNLVCYHLAASLPIHLVLASQRAGK